MGGLSQLVGSVTLSSSLQLLPAPLARIASLLPLLGWLAFKAAVAEARNSTDAVAQASHRQDLEDKK